MIGEIAIANEKYPESDCSRIMTKPEAMRRPEWDCNGDSCPARPKLPKVTLWEVCRPDLTPVTRRLRKPLGRIVAISYKWPGCRGIVQVRDGVIRQVT